jgi:DNA-binding transcriptional MerR regulator
MPDVVIPDKPAFKAGEVCELAQIQPYVLRSWESEFPDLGLSKTPGGPRIYRRADVERVLRIRDLVFTEGLTLSGVRRRFEAEQPPAPDDLFTLTAELHAAEAANASPAPVRVAARESAAPSAPVAPPVSDEARARLLKVKQDMRSLLDLLDTPGTAAAPAQRSRRG